MMVQIVVHPLGSFFVCEFQDGVRCGLVKLTVADKEQGFPTNLIKLIRTT